MHHEHMVLSVKEKETLTLTDVIAQSHRQAYLHLKAFKSHANFQGAVKVCTAGKSHTNGQEMSKSYIFHTPRKI